MTFTSLPNTVSLEFGYVVLTSRGGQWASASGHKNVLRSFSSGADSIGHGGHVPPLLQMAGHGGTVSRTANNKMTKL